MSVPAPRPRVAFPQIAGVSWEHPADRAALQAMRAVPGFDDVVRKIIAILGGERGIRLLFQGNAVRTGPTQFPRAHSLLVEIATDHVVFTNPQHDFPKRISYQRSGNELHARVDDGTDFGEGEDFVYTLEP